MNLFYHPKQDASKAERVNSTLCTANGEGIWDTGYKLMDKFNFSSCENFTESYSIINIEVQITIVPIRGRSISEWNNATRTELGFKIMSSLLLELASARVDILE